MKESRTPFEGFFLSIMDWFEEREVDVMIQGSTLLNIVRSGTVEPREDVLQDKEINLFILAEDFTDMLYKEMKQSFPYFKTINDKLPNAGVYFGRKPLKSSMTSHWTLDPGFVYMPRLWQGRSTRFKYQGGDSCIVIPNRFVNFKSKWESVEILDRKFRGPAHIEEYLEFYYGDWKTEQKDWHWSKDSPHLVKWEDMTAGKEI